MRSKLVLISKLERREVDCFEPILRRSLFSWHTGKIFQSKVDEILDCMRGQKDTLGRVRKYFVAKNSSGTLLGCIGFSRAEPELLKCFGLREGNCIEMLNFYVEKEQRGKGIGTKLFHAVVAEARRTNKQGIVWHSGPRFKPTWVFYDKLADRTGLIRGRYGGVDAQSWLKNV